MSQSRAQMQLLVEADMDAIQARSCPCMLTDFSQHPDRVCHAATCRCTRRFSDRCGQQRTPLNNPVIPVSACVLLQRAQDSQTALAAAQEERDGLKRATSALRGELARRGEEASAAAGEAAACAQGAAGREERLRREVTSLETRLANGQHVADGLRAAADRTLRSVRRPLLACEVESTCPVCLRQPGSC